MTKPPVVLVICDGWGEIAVNEGNAIAAAQTPILDQLREKWPHTLLHASGEHVGLPVGQQGNSEVGHLTIGSGRVIRQDLSLQQHAIKTGVFFENEILISAIELAKQRNSRLHVMGLLSPGGVHSHQDSALAVVKLAKDLGQNDILVHAFTDGRDTPPKSSKEHIEGFQKGLEEVGAGSIASLSGRYYAMDRDNRWDRTEQVYRMLTDDEYDSHVSALDYINERYVDGQTDEFLLPVRIGNTRHKLQDGDVVIFFNFRPDRARQLTHALVDADFRDFERNKIIQDLHVVTFTEYDPSLGTPVAFPKERIKNTLAEIVSKQGLRQFHIAETEKYAHVTYFLNGGEEVPFEHEDRLLVPSPPVATYDESPQMSAVAITDELLQALHKKSYELLVINYANPDMVGHTGNFDATVKAVETVDECIGRIVEGVQALGGIVAITADHGNAETEINTETGTPLTSHTSNPVPFIIIGATENQLKDGGSLSDVAPTILHLMKLDQPEEMTGENLLFTAEAAYELD
jgi:2,3-bisphosphoglycerate-independent phosphoglycerate mutase